MKWGKTLKHLFSPRASNNHRARILHPEVIAGLCVAMVGIFTVISAWHAAPGRLGSVLGFASNITVQDVVAQTNEQRKTQGLAPLVFNSELSQAAQAKGKYMMLKQYWAHIAPDGTQPWFFIKNAGYSYSVAGENLARDFSDTPDMVQAWMNSPTHRANIMNPNFKDIGIAVVNGTLLGDQTTLVVQMFGTPLVATTQPKVSPTATITLQNQVAEVVPAPVVPSQAVTIPPASPIPSQPSARIPVADNVLGTIQLPQGNLSVPPLFTPLQILKAVFLAVILMLVFTLTYDSLVMGHKQVVRLVGHNLSHVVLFIIIAYLLLSFKAGILG